jgi:transcription initiation factor TFIID TATA-box-binding protein
MEHDDGVDALCALFDDAAETSEAPVEVEKLVEFCNKSFPDAPGGVPTASASSQERAASVASDSVVQSIDLPHNHMVTIWGEIARDWQAELTATFMPGDTGISADWDRGKVIHVAEGSQANREGVTLGMKMIRINGYDYSKVLLDRCAAGREAYQVTFAKDSPDLPDPSADYELPSDVFAKPFVTTASFSLGCQIDVKAVAFGLRHAEYNPRKHSSITLRLLEPRATALVRASGKVSIVANCTKEVIKQGAKKVARMIQRTGQQDVKFVDFRVTSVGAQADCLFPIRIDKLAEKWRRNAAYEPEVYSGCVFKTRVPPCTYLVTAGGKVKICGCQNMQQVEDCLRRAYPEFSKFQQ